LPEVIGVITSPTGAVIRDIMHRLNARFARRVLLWPVAVQGERAAGEIAAAITGFNTPGPIFPKPDLIIVARGGGSVEDLMAFNDEAVVRAAAASAIPLISAVGHETDTTLIDFAADMRAPTPSAAAELAVPVRTELLAQTLDLQRRALSCFTRGMQQRRRNLAQLTRLLPRPEQLFSASRQRLDIASERLSVCLRVRLQKARAGFAETAALLRPGVILRHVALGGERIRTLEARAIRAQGAHIARAQDHLQSLSRILDGISYRAVLERGFALVRGADGVVRRRAAQLKPGERLTLIFADGEARVSGGSAPVKPHARKPGGDQGSLF
jgi:exodeoxyribonuclease VII large subunit